MLFRSPFGPSAIDEILDRAEAADNEEDDVLALLELLDESDILTEANSDHKRLIQFLSQARVLKKLVDFCVKDSTDTWDDPDLDSKHRFKYPFVASEILSLENYRLSEDLLRNEELAKKIFGYFRSAEPTELDNTRASHVAKIISALLRCKNVEVLHLLMHSPDFIPSLLANLSNSAVADLVVRLLDGPDADRFFRSTLGQPRKEAVDLVAKANVLEELSNKFVACCDDEEMVERQREETISNASQLLVTLCVRMLQLKRVSFTIPSSLNVYEIPERIIGPMLDAGIRDYHKAADGRSSPLLSALTTAADILVTDANLTDEEDGFMKQPSVNNVISMMARMSRQKMFGNDGENSSTDKRSTLESTDVLEATLRSRFEALNELLTREKPGNSFTNTSGEIKKPFGTTKLKIIEFFVACLKQGNSETVDALLELKVPETFQNIFFSYEWSSMVLNTVTTAIVHALERGSESTQKAWLEAGLHSKLMATWMENANAEKSRPRAGNMGHVIVLSRKLEEVLRQRGGNGSDTFTLIPKEEAAAFYNFCENLVSREVQRQNQMLVSDARAGEEDMDRSATVEESN